MDNRLLWQNIPLPAWNAERMFQLYLAHTSGEPTKTERDAYARLLMVYIAANMGRRKWFSSLRRRGIDPEDAASDVLAFLIEKTPALKFDTPCVRVLLKALNTAIFRRLVSEVRASEARIDEILEAEWCQEDGSRPISFVSAGHEKNIVEWLERAMRGAEDEICQGHWRDQISICVLYRFLCRQVVRQNVILPYSQLPERLRRRISIGQHATIAYRLNKFIGAFAAAA